MVAGKEAKMQFLQPMHECYKTTKNIINNGLQFHPGWTPEQRELWLFPTGIVGWPRSE